MLNNFNPSFLLYYYLKKIIQNTLINLIFSYKVPLVLMIAIYIILTIKEIEGISELPFYNLEANKIYIRLIAHELMLLFEFLSFYQIYKNYNVDLYRLFFMMIFLEIYKTKISEVISNQLINLAYSNRNWVWVEIIYLLNFLKDFD